MFDSLALCLLLQRHRKHAVDKEGKRHRLEVNRTRGVAAPRYIYICYVAQLQQFEHHISEKSYLVWEDIKLFCTYVFQAGRLLLNESAFGSLQNIFLKHIFLNLLALIGVLTEHHIKYFTYGRNTWERSLGTEAA